MKKTKAMTRAAARATKMVRTTTEPAVMREVPIERQVTDPLILDVPSMELESWARRYLTEDGRRKVKAAPLCDRSLGSAAKPVRPRAA